MAYVTIDPTTIEVGDAITADLFTLIKDNLDDLDTRVTTLGSGSGTISLINTDVRIGSTDDQFLTGAFHFEVFQDCIITEGAIQLFEKSPATTGSLTVDVKKNTTTNPAGFNTVFSSAPTINIATAADYDRATGTVNPSAQTLTAGDIIRVDITSLPAGLQRFRVVLKGVF
jgi:hypothetical protein